MNDTISLSSLKIAIEQIGVTGGGGASVRPNLTVNIAADFAVSEIKTISLTGRMFQPGMKFFNLPSGYTQAPIVINSSEAASIEVTAPAVLTTQTGVITFGTEGSTHFPSSVLITFLMPISLDEAITPLLSTNQAAFIAATGGNWVNITDAEYLNLVNNIAGVSRFGTTEANMLTGTFASFSGGAAATFGQNSNPSVSAGKVFAFKFASTIAFVYGTGANRVRLSTNGINNFQTLGGGLPSSTVHNSQSHFVLKTATTTTSLVYLGGTALEPNAKMYYNAIGTTGRYGTSSTANPGAVSFGWSMQALIL